MGKRRLLRHNLERRCRASNDSSFAIRHSTRPCYNSATHRLLMGRRDVTMDWGWDKDLSERKERDA
jgi:hypothetical protein